MVEHLDGRRRRNRNREVLFATPVDHLDKEPRRGAVPEEAHIEPAGRAVIELNNALRRRGSPSHGFASSAAPTAHTSDGSLVVAGPCASRGPRGSGYGAAGGRPTHH